MDTPPTPEQPAMPPAPPPHRRSAPTVVLEILGYAGAAAALSATGVAFDATTSAEQVAIGLVVTVVLVLVGSLVGAHGDALHRMRSVFWFVAVLSWISVVAVLVGPDGVDLQDKWLVVVAAALTAMVALPLWLRERRSLQLIAAFLSLHVAVAALVFSMKTESFFGMEQEIPNLRWSALVTALFGVAGLVLGMRGALVPKRTAMVLGALAFMAGLPLVFTDLAGQLVGALAGGAATSNLSIVVGLLAGAIVLVIGSRAQVVAVIGLGIVQLGYTVIHLVIANVHETGPALAVLAAGLVVLGATVVLARSAKT